MVAIDRAGRTIWTPYPYPTWIDTDHSMLEFDLISECMRGKGYALAPVEQSTTPH